MVREYLHAQEIDALIIIYNLHFERMEVKVQIGIKELAYLPPIVLKQGFRRIEDDEIVNVADIEFCFELMLDELVKLIEIDISKELRRQVP